jgi:hypothetical protein
MKRDIEPVDLKRIKTYSVADRLSKVNVAELAAGWTAGGSFAAFLERLPNLLAAADLKAVIAAIVDARRKQRPVIRDGATSSRTDRGTDDERGFTG